MDRIPEVAHKMYKKKKWRKQFFEGMRRVCCRLSAGLGFRPNCQGEDAFIHIVLGSVQELGWRRISEHIDPLPETDKDRDFSKCLKLANDDMGSLLKGLEPAIKIKGGIKIKEPKPDIKGWFKCYQISQDHLFDHIIQLDDKDMDDWSVNTESTSGSSQSGSRSGRNSLSNTPVGTPTSSHMADAMNQGFFTEIAGSPTRIRARSRGDSTMSDLSVDGDLPVLSGSLNKDCTIGSNVEANKAI
jgi:hypothetical protein